MLPERDSRCIYNEVCDESVCDGMGHCKDAAEVTDALYDWRNRHIDKLSVPAWGRFNEIVEFIKIQLGK
jgi:hypothetical protein